MVGLTPRRYEHQNPVPHNDAHTAEITIEQVSLILCSDDNSMRMMDEPDDSNLSYSYSRLSSFEETPEDTEQERQGLLAHSISTVASTSPTFSWQQRLRKTTVAVGGGTLVGVGAVIMATPLHPIGHAMALGGVGLLGTEFEAPKRAWKKCCSFIKQPKETAAPAAAAAAARAAVPNKNCIRIMQ